MYVSSNNSLQQLGGGEMIIITDEIRFNNLLIPARIWLDCASSLTLVSRKFVMDNKIRLTKSVINFVIQGINSSSVTKDSFYAEFELHVGSRFIKVTALVSDSSLFDGDILLGEDI